MQAWAVVENGAPLDLIEIETPLPHDEEVVVKVSHCGVCHSDLHFWKGAYNLGGGKVLKVQDTGVVLPRAPGHEIVGVVSNVGPRASNVKIGDRVIVYPWVGCGQCEYCKDELDNLCSRQQSLGVVQHGGFAQYVKVPSSRYVVPLGDLDPAAASVLSCSGITVYGAIKRAFPLAPEEPIVLFGAGGLGLLAVGMLKAFGHKNIVSIDIDEDKRIAATHAGATATIDGAAPELARKIIDAGGTRPKAVIDFVNNDTTASVGFQVLAKGGRLVLVGMSGGELTISLATTIFRRTSIQAVLTGGIGELRELVDLAKQGKVPVPAITTMPMSKANDALNLLAQGKIVGRAVLTA
ncbi:MAG: alcohol dehydrogenase [Flavobacteriaceae bacterium]